MHEGMMYITSGSYDFLLDEEKSLMCDELLCAPFQFTLIKLINLMI